MLIIDCTSLPPDPSLGVAIRSAGEPAVFFCAPGQRIPAEFPAYSEGQRVGLPMDGDPTVALEQMVETINSAGRAQWGSRWKEIRQFANGCGPSGTVHRAQLWTARRTWARISERFGLTFVLPPGCRALAERTVG